MVVYVKSKRELAKAIRSKNTDIVICNKKLADLIKKFKGQDIPDDTRHPSKDMLGAVTGMETVYIVAIITLGVVCLYALYKDYDITGTSPYGDIKMRRNK